MEGGEQAQRHLGWMGSIGACFHDWYLMSRLKGGGNVRNKYVKCEEGTKCRWEEEDEGLRKGEEGDDECG